MRVCLLNLNLVIELHIITLCDDYNNVNNPTFNINENILKAIHHIFNILYLTNFISDISIK